MTTDYYKQIKTGAKTVIDLHAFDGPISGRRIAFGLIENVVCGVKVYNHIEADGRTSGSTIELCEGRNVHLHQTF